MQWTFITESSFSGDLLNLFLLITPTSFCVYSLHAPELSRTPQNPHPHNPQNTDRQHQHHLLQISPIMRRHSEPRGELPPTNKVYIHKAAVGRNLTLSLRESSFSESSGRQTCSSRPAQVWICMTFAWGVPAAASYGLQTHRWPRPRLSLLSLTCSRSAAVQTARTDSRRLFRCHVATPHPEAFQSIITLLIHHVCPLNICTWPPLFYADLSVVFNSWFVSVVSLYSCLFMREILIFVSHDNFHV